MLEENNKSFDYDKTINVMKNNYTLPEGFKGDENEWFYELAQKKFPELKLPDYPYSNIEQNE